MKRPSAARLREGAHGAARLIRGDTRPPLSRNDRNVDLVLATLLANHADLTSLADPARYTEFLRGCIEPIGCTIETIRDDTVGLADEPAKRLATLLEVLSTDVPPLPVALSMEVATFADRLWRRTEPFVLDTWAADVGRHALISSSAPRKARVLAAAIRFGRCSSGLELGTGYGMASVYLLPALAANEPLASLTTVEWWEPQYSLAAELLRSAHGDKVEMRFGDAGAVAGALIEEGQRFDFLFHDALHSGEAFLADFRTVVPALEPGAIVLFDDIAWEDERMMTSELPCHDGWLQITASDEVRAAIEIDGSLGLLLIR